MEGSVSMIHVVDHMTDRILGFLQNKAGSPKIFWNDEHTISLKDNLETFDFTMLATIDEAEHFSKRNRVVIPDEDGFFREFIIIDTQQRNNIKEVRTNASFTELAGQKILDPQTLQSMTVSDAATFVLGGTDWQVGQTNYAGLRTIVFEDYTDALEAVKRIASEFGLELRFRIEISGNRIIGRYVDFIERVGMITNKEIVFGKDLIGVTRKENSANIVTALLCLGPEREDGTRLVVRVYDEEARQRWGRNGRHIWGIYTAESSNLDMTEEQLTQLGEAELQKRINTVVEYEVEQVSIEHIFGRDHEKVRIGDEVRVKDPTYSPPIYLDARIIQIKRSISDPSQKTYTLGDFIEYKEEDIMKTFKALQAVLRKKASVGDIQAVREYAEQVAETAEGNAKEYADVVAIEAENSAKDHADQQAQQAENNAKNYTNTYAEKKIAKGSTAPSNPGIGDLWIDTSVTPNLLKRWTGSAWQKLVPTTAAEIGAVDVNTYNTKVQQLSNDIAAKADATWVNGQLVLKENAITKSNTAPANPTTGQLWLDTSTTPNVLKRWTGSAWVKATPTSAGEVGAYTKTEVDNALNSKVSVTQYNTDMNGVVTRLNSAESRITQNEQEIATKVSSTQYQQDKTALESDISSLETRMANAETQITQNASQIALKANKTDVYTKGEVDTALSNKADDSRVDTIETRVSNAEAQLTVQANQIATKVSQTEFTQELAKKENSVVKSSTAPSNPTTNMLWLDTSVTPNVLKRWSGSAWIKVTPTTAGEVGAYTKSETDTKLGTKANQSDLNTLTTRVSTAETNITQLSNQITLKANASDVYTKQQVDTSLAGKADVSTVSTIEQRVTQAEAQLTVQAGEIATKVSQSTFDTQMATKANASDVYTKTDIQSSSANNLIHNSEWKTDTNSWILSTGWTRDTSKTFQGSNTMKVDVSGLSSNAWMAIYSEFIDVSEGQQLVASGYVFSDDINTIDRGASLVIEWYNSTSRISTSVGSCKPTDNNTWQRFSATGVAPTGTIKARIRFHPDRNGRFWVARPMLQFGKIPTAFTPHVDELATNITSRLATAESSITQLSDQILLKVNKSEYDIDVNNLKSRMSSAESQLTIQAGQIATKVEKNGVISAINQTAEQVKIQASKIALDGYVEAKHIKSLNGLNVNNQFIVDSNGNVKFSGNLEGATGTFSGDIITDSDAKVGNNLYVGKPNEEDPVSIKHIVFNYDVGGVVFRNYIQADENTADYVAEQLRFLSQIIDAQMMTTDGAELLLTQTIAQLISRNGGDIILNSSNNIELNCNGVINAYRNLIMRGSATLKTDRGWISPAFINGWTNYGSGFQTAGYYMDAEGFIHLKGMIAQGSVGYAAFQLPAGYRPSARRIFSVMTNTGIGRVDIDINGYVLVLAPSTNGWVSLENIKFTI
jgi:phage minor structural protein